MLKEFIHSLRMLTIMTFVLGILYPVVMTGFAQTVFQEKANGSIVYKESNPVGSKLIGQGFTSERYFHSRPSSAGENGYDAASSSGSNLGPTSAKLIAAVSERAKEVRAKNNMAPDAAVPSDLVTASGSGLDPHISPQAAAVQIKRVAAVRNIAAEKVAALVQKYTIYPTLGFMGDARVNVLQLNLELDSMK